jgi:Lar family restriction alleviation protein
MTTIKPCPFCGCEDYLSHITEQMHRHYVSCACGAIGPVCQERDEAAEAWNRRSPAASAEPVGCLVRPRLPDATSWTFYADLSGHVPQRAAEHPDLYERMDVVRQEI